MPYQILDEQRVPGNENIRNAVDSNAECLEPLSSARIAVGDYLLFMLLSVHFDRESKFGAIEVEHKTVEWELTAELEAAERAIA